MPLGISLQIAVLKKHAQHCRYATDMKEAKGKSKKVFLPCWNLLRSSSCILPKALGSLDETLYTPLITELVMVCLETLQHIR